LSVHPSRDGPTEKVSISRPHNPTLNVLNQECLKEKPVQMIIKNYPPSISITQVVIWGPENRVRRAAAVLQE
jgi:hypothetical protein